MRSHYDFFYEKVPQWFTINLVDSNGNNVYVGVNEKKLDIKVWTYEVINFSYGSHAGMLSQTVCALLLGSVSKYTRKSKVLSM